MSKKEKITKELAEKINKLSNNMEKVHIEPIKIQNKTTKNSKSLSFGTIEVVILVFLTAIISLIVGGAVTYKIYNNNLTKVDKHLQKFINNYNEIKDNYYDNVDENKLINGAIQGMVESLDDYSSYFNTTETTNFNVKLEGKYVGVGLEIYNDNNNDIVVHNVFENSPAEVAGITAGDILTKINNQDYAKQTTSSFVQAIKNLKSKTFTITYVRDGQEHTVDISTAQINIKSVTSKVYTQNDKKIGYIDISIFANNTYSQVKKALKNLEGQNIDSLIVDVRSNSGGHLTSVKNILGLFLDSSKVIYQTQTKTKTVKVYSEGKTTKTYPIVVLINGSSASASEVLASALKEQYGATLIGTKSYGKGTIQEMRTMDDGTQYKITTKKWLTSKATWINGTGIEPDVKISLDENYTSNPIEDNDNQLHTALNQLSS